MKRSVDRTALFEQDVDAAQAFLVESGGDLGAELAERFAVALFAAVDRLRTIPGLGSRRFSALLGIPGLRSLPLQGIPWTLMYRATRERIVLLRVLHQRSDLLRLAGRDLSKRRPPEH